MGALKAYAEPSICYTFLLSKQSIASVMFCLSVSIEQHGARKSFGQISTKSAESTCGSAA